MEDKNKITIFGATGKIGKELLTFLSAAGITAIAVTRNKNKAKEMPSVEWVEANMLSKATLYNTMKNSKVVFLASSINDNFVEEQNNVIEVAKEQGVTHIVKLSSPGAVKNSPFFIAKLHFEVEESLKASGLSWTILQPNSFMQNWLGEFSETIKRERKIYEGTGDGKKPFIDTRDIAEVAFKILTNPAEHSNQTYLLTADEAVNYAEVAEAISNAIGDNVQFIPLTIDELEQRMKRKGMPPLMIQTFIAIAEGQRQGKATFTNTIVKDILNKPSRTIHDFAMDYASWFK
ncbi:SDR family oxidoreductase [Chitinophaga filiformis]|uniref:SDR family oxidoreductase n=1 Tax=Chitinophaga filiformis TaxID=104663 RepID=UPI001F2D4F9B|nr:SDR family oxidoreductase [Chitinophaga filiformis]MCF6405134.1 SDR family oxidoreductase [Chitinophaga filiformis]